MEMNYCQLVTQFKSKFKVFYIFIYLISFDLLANGNEFNTMRLFQVIILQNLLQKVSKMMILLIGVWVENGKIFGLKRKAPINHVTLVTVKVLI